MKKNQKGKKKKKKKEEEEEPMAEEEEELQKRRVSFSARRIASCRRIIVMMEHSHPSVSLSLSFTLSVSQAEMALLMEDDHAAAKHKHFNYDKIVEQQNLSKKKRKKLLKKGEEPLEEDDFQVQHLFYSLLCFSFCPSTAVFYEPNVIFLLPLLCFINYATFSLVPPSGQIGEFIIVLLVLFFSLLKHFLCSRNSTYEILWLERKDEETSFRSFLKVCYMTVNLSLSGCRWTSETLVSRPCSPPTSST